MAMETQREIVQVFMECMTDSPYIPQDHKNALAVMFLDGNIAALEHAMQVHRSDGAVRPSNPLLNMKAMVTAVFSSSKKIAQLPIARKQQIGMLIHTAGSLEELREHTLNGLMHSQVIGEESKMLIANDMFDQRYDRLLLPDRFDCEEIPRLHRTADGSSVAAADTDCPICLMERQADRELPCGHSFCGECITGWVQQARGITFTCPMCRARHSRSLFPAVA